jgi:hypothetical protein
MSDSQVDRMSLMRHWLAISPDQSGWVILWEEAAGGAVGMSLPSHARAEAQRILDAAARRLLHELDTDTASTPAGTHDDPGDDGANQPAALRDRQGPPVTGRVDHDSGTKAA